MNIKDLLALLLGFFLSQYVAADEWLCTTESGQRQGNTILACGVADWNEEGLARKKALQSAIEEFRTICDLSDDCREKKFNVEPKRTSCIKQRNDLIKCYRLIEVHLLE